MLASQAAVALANAQWSQGLEQKVAAAHRRSCRRPSALLEQRASELAIINSIQQGMAAELDFQAIVDLVGDKLREVLHTGDIGIRWFDRAGRPGALPVRVRARRAARHCRPCPLRPRSSTTLARPRQPLVVPTAAAEQMALGIERGAGHRREPLGDGRARSSAATGCSAPSSTRGLRARERLRRRRRAPAAAPWPRAWAWRWRTRACSTRRSGC